MNKKEKSKRTLIILIVSCLILISLFIIAINLLIAKQKRQEYEESIKEFQNFRTEYESQTILPRKIYELYEYDGYYDRDFLYKHMKKFVDYLGYLKLNVNLKNSREYFNLYSDEILNIIGIDSYEKFEKFIKTLENKNVILEQFKYAEIKSGSSYNDGNYFKFILHLYYGDNNEPSEFNVSFSRKKNNDSPMIYEFIR